MVVVCEEIIDWFLKVCGEGEIDMVIMVMLISLKYL